MCLFTYATLDPGILSEAAYEKHHEVKHAVDFVRAELLEQLATRIAGGDVGGALKNVIAGIRGIGGESGRVEKAAALTCMRGHAFWFPIMLSQKEIHKRVMGSAFWEEMATKRESGAEGQWRALLRARGPGAEGRDFSRGGRDAGRQEDAARLVGVHELRQRGGGRWGRAARWRHDQQRGVNLCRTSCCCYYAGREPWVKAWTCVVARPILDQVRGRGKGARRGGPALCVRWCV